MIHVQQVLPSPSTPTYEEAMKDIQRAVGFQAPKYTPAPNEVLGVEESVQDSPRENSIHPLERQRLFGLMGHTMSSQRL